MEKPGIKTSEFWVTLFGLGTMFYQQFTGHDTSVIAQTGVAAITAAYNFARAFVKKGK